MCYTSSVPRQTKSGLDKFLGEAMKEDWAFRELFWNEVAKLPARSRARIERGLEPLPR